MKELLNLPNSHKIPFLLFFLTPNVPVLTYLPHYCARWQKSFFKYQYLFSVTKSAGRDDIRTLTVCRPCRTNSSATKQMRSQIASRLSRQEKKKEWMWIWPVASLDFGGDKKKDIFDFYLRVRTYFYSHFLLQSMQLHQKIWHSKMLCYMGTVEWNVFPRVHFFLLFPILGLPSSFSHL